MVCGYVGVQESSHKPLRLKSQLSKNSLLSIHPKTDQGHSLDLREYFSGPVYKGKKAQRAHVQVQEVLPCYQL